MPRRLRTAAVSLALLSALAACGGSSSSSPNTTDGNGTTQGDRSTNPPTATLAPGSTTNSTTGGDFCSLATGSLTSDLNAGLTSGDVEALMTRRESNLNALKDKVPNDVKADVTVIVDATQKMLDLFKKYNYDYTKIFDAAQSDPAVQAQLASLTSADIATASQHVAAYCGLTTTTT